MSKELYDLRASVLIWRGHEDDLIKSTWALKGGVNQPWLIGRADHQNALVVAAQSIQFMEKLVHQVAKLPFSHVPPIHREGVDLIEDQHAGCICPSGLEDLVQVSLTATEVGIKNFMQPDRQVVARHFSGHSAEDVRLPAARWAIDHDAAARLFAVGFVEVWVLQRVDDLQPDFFFEIIHASDIGKGHPRALRISRCIKGLRPPFKRRIAREWVIEKFRARLALEGRIIKSALRLSGRSRATRIAHCATQFALENRVHQRPISLGRQIKMLGGACLVSFTEADATQQKVGRRIVWISLQYALGPHSRAGEITFGIQNLGHTQLGIDLSRIEFQDPIKDLARFVRAVLFKTLAGEQKKQRDVFGRLSQGVADGGKS